jgi:hypothetical protein
VRRTIDQFMWAYQFAFRPGVEHGIEHALVSIGAPMAIRTVLVGYRAEAGVRHDVCVEPESGPLTQAHFRGVLDVAAEKFAADPEADLMHSNRELHELRQRALYRRARAKATAEAVEASGALPGMRVFASDSAPIGGYEVHTCIGVEASRIDALHAFDDDTYDRMYVGRSLAHEVITECLRRADRALYLPDPGADLENLGAPTTEIVRAAGRRFLDGCVIRSGGVPSDLLDRLSSVVSLAYERDQAHGRLLVVAPSHPRLESRGQLARAVSMTESRAVRKLLEISDHEVAILFDGRDVFGFGAVASPVEVSDDPAVFEIVVPGHATFELRHNRVPLMRVAYGQPALSRPLLDWSIFDEAVRRTIGDAEIELLWRLVNAAASAGHGTTIVISADAVGEAARLAGQATRVVPAELSTEDVVRFSRIDGAILLDVNGVCHAIGVILDGRAAGSGNPSRGSRFNSSVRYQESALAATVVIVVSEDGSVDLVPDLQPQVSREEVAAAVAAFRAAATADPVEGEAFARAHDSVKAYGFYLDEEQCNEVNELFNAEQDRRLEGGGIAIRGELLRPDPGMNDSYFLPTE